MKPQKSIGCAATLAILAAASRAAALPTCPGADGAGAGASGGRGGIVYHVTRLDGNEINANSPGRGNVLGSLAYGVNDNNFKIGGIVQPRTIVFDVGGTFWLGQKTPSGGSAPTEGWDTQDPLSLGSNITIAGQTAPGGVYIMGGGLKVNGANAIIRNVTVAPGWGARSLNSTTGYADSYVYDAMNIHAANVMVDHVTTVFATDEAISADEFATNVTVQYSNISQGQNYPQADAENPGVYTGHALGSLLQPGSNAPISVLHNLYAHQKGRLPRVGTQAGSLTVAGVGAYNDFRNNVFYNWLGTAGSGASGQPGQSNFVNNFYRAGPGGDNNSGTTIVNSAGGAGIFSGSDSTNTRVFHSGNLKDINKDGDANDGVALTNSDFGSSNFQASPLWFNGVPTYTGVTDTATVAFSRVLSYAGANWNNRDAIDARIFGEASAGTGQIMAFNDATHGTEWNSLLNLRPATFGGIGGSGAYARPANWDTDGDGMPDAWEATVGLNPNVADNNGDFDGDGYTNLEEYLNDISAWPAPTPITWVGNNGRYAIQGNWDINWQPSRYDTVQINSGIATIDAFDQATGVVSIGAGGILNITAGGLDVAGNITVLGNLNWTSGQLGTTAATSLTVGNGSNAAGVVLGTGQDKTLQVHALTINANAKIDLTDNAMIVDSGSVSTIASLVAAGYADGALTGDGITSSSAASAATSMHKTAVGYATAASVGITVFNGQSVDPASILVLYTLAGDANLDREVDTIDFNSLAANFSQGGKFWFQADLNFDGIVDTQDFNALAANFGQSIGTAAPGVLIPEPASLALLAAGALLSRRRR